MSNVFFIFENYSSKNAEPEIIREKEIEHTALLMKGVDFCIDLPTPEYFARIDGKMLVFRQSIGSKLRTDTIQLLLKNGVDFSLFASELDQVIVEQWYLNAGVDKFLKRKIAIVTPDELLNRLSFQYPFFLKNLDLTGATNFQIHCNKWHHVINDFGDLSSLLLNFADSYKSYLNPLLISELLNITEDEIWTDHELTKCTREWRCFVVDNKISSISRYRDYQKGGDYNEIIPELLVSIINQFITTSGMRCANYVVDFCEFINQDNEIDYALVELNQIESSGRYEDNDVNKLIDDIGRYADRVINKVENTRYITARHEVEGLAQVIKGLIGVAKARKVENNN